MPLSVYFAGLGIREVSGQKREQSIISTALTERIDQRIFAYFLSLQINGQEPSSPATRASVPGALLEPLRSSGNPTTRT